MKFFIDTADLEEIRDLSDTGLLDGVTTNPSLIAKSGGISVKDFVFGAMTGSFLTAPVFAWMAMDTMNSSLVKSQFRYGIVLKTVCWFGISFLSVFSLLFIFNSFFGIGQ